MYVLPFCALVGTHTYKQIDRQRGWPLTI